jgi:hypothetical protein
MCSESLCRVKLPFKVVDTYGISDVSSEISCHTHTYGIQSVWVHGNWWTVLLADQEPAMPAMHMSVTGALYIVKDPLITSIRVPVGSKKRLTSCTLIDKSRSAHILLLKVDDAIREPPSMYSTVSVDPNVFAIAVGEDRVACDSIESAV